MGGGKIHDFWLREQKFHVTLALGNESSRLQKFQFGYPCVTVAVCNCHVSATRFETVADNLAGEAAATTQELCVELLDNNVASSAIANESTMSSLYELPQSATTVTMTTPTITKPTITGDLLASGSACQSDGLADSVGTAADGVPEQHASTAARGQNSRSPSMSVREYCEAFERWSSWQQQYWWMMNMHWMTLAAYQHMPGQSLYTRGSSTGTTTTTLPVNRAQQQQQQQPLPQPARGTTSQHMLLLLLLLILGFKIHCLCRFSFNM